MPHTRLDPYERLYARRTGTLRSSAMRDLMAVTARPEVISLAGGLPDTKRLPGRPAARADRGRRRRERGPRALQYGPTEGIDELRHALAALMAEGGTEAGPGELIVTTGGQQAIDLLCRVHARPRRPDPGRGADLPRRRAVVLGLRRRGAPGRRWTPRASGSTGWPRRTSGSLAEGRPPKFLYVIPTFQNPAGADAVAGAPPRAGGLRPGARPAAGGGRPVRPAALRGRAAADAALARRHGPRASTSAPSRRSSRPACGSAGSTRRTRSSTASTSSSRPTTSARRRSRSCSRWPSCSTSAAHEVVAAADARLPLAARRDGRRAARVPARRDLHHAGRRPVPVGHAGRRARHHRPAGRRAGAQRRVRAGRRGATSTASRAPPPCGSTSRPATRSGSPRASRRIGDVARERAALARALGPRSRRTAQ